LPKLATSLTKLGAELSAVVAPAEEVVEDHRRLARANAAA
jgi:hypothetical protein